MNAKHTPGPWSVRQYFEEGSFTGYTVYVSPFDGIADIPANDAEGEANAVLIAAAPDMLEALRAIESCLSPADCDRAANLVRDAIKKAEGR